MQTDSSGPSGVPSAERNDAASLRCEGGDAFANAASEWQSMFNALTEAVCILDLD